MQVTSDKLEVRSQNTEERAPRFRCQDEAKPEGCEF